MKMEVVLTSAAYVDPVELRAFMRAVEEVAEHFFGPLEESSLSCPQACRSYDPYFVDEDENGEAVDPTDCLVCRMPESAHAKKGERG